MRRLLFLCLLLVSMAPPPARAQGTLLRLNYVPGARYVTTNHDTTDQRMAVRIPGIPEEPDQNTRAIRYSVHEITVEADGDSAFVVTSAYRRMRLHTVTRGLADIVDTDSAASVQNSSLGRLLRAFVGQPMRSRITHTGRVTLLEDLDSLLARVAATLPGSSEEREEARTQMRAVLEAARQHPLPILPAEPVLPGATWGYETTLGGGMPFSLVGTNRYEEGPDGLARITSTLQVPGDTVTVGEAPMTLRLRLTLHTSSMTELDPRDAGFRTLRTIEMETQSLPAGPAPGASDLSMRMYMRTRSHAHMERTDG